jgi:hypothetical protein
MRELAGGARTPEQARDLERMIFGPLVIYVVEAYEGRY